MTDYALYSDWQAAANTANQKAATKARVRQYIAAMSELVELATGRRFDHRIEAIPVNTRRVDSLRGGNVDTEDGTILILPDDLQSVTELINNEIDPVDPADYDLLPLTGRAPFKNMIQLYNGYYWGYSTIPSKGAVVTGVWGYGGRWINKTTLSADVNSSALALSVASVTGLEMRQTIRVGSEYMTIDSEVSTSPISVERGVNGSTAAAHLAGAVLAVFEPNALVKRLVIRLVKWQSELDDSPLVGEVNVGDTSVIVDLTKAPLDARQIIELLTRPADIRGA